LATDFHHGGYEDLFHATAPPYMRPRKLLKRYRVNKRLKKTGQ
jgi:hypothetical protein